MPQDQGTEGRCRNCSSGSRWSITISNVHWLCAYLLDQGTGHKDGDIPEPVLNHNIIDVSALCVPSGPRNAPKKHCDIAELAANHYGLHPRKIAILQRKVAIPLSRTCIGVIHTSQTQEQRIHGDGDTANKRPSITSYVYWSCVYRLGPGTLSGNQNKR